MPDETNTRPDNQEQRPPIRRGQGLKLSTGAPPAETPPAEEPAAPAQSSPPRRGQALRLSTAALDAVTADRPAPPPTSIATHKLEMAHGALHYRQAGSGPPLLLLHGWGSSSRVWRETMLALGDRQTCYAPDLPGFGQSPAMGAPTATADLAELIVSFANQLDLQRFALVGHSFGAAVAVYIAARHPQRVSRLALTAFGVGQTPGSGSVGLAMRKWQTWLNLWQPWLRLWQPWTAVMLQAPPVSQLLAAWFMRRLPDDNLMLRELFEDMAHVDLHAQMASTSSLDEPGIFAAIGAVAAPTLLLAGRGDQVVTPIEVAAAGARQPRARQHFFDDCGHMPMIEVPTEYNRVLREFMAER